MPLADRLRARIAAEGPLRVDDFMRAALYDPDEGYYARGARIGGEGADFYTAANASLFHRAMRRFVDAALERLPGARVVELGGGTGGLARALAADGGPRVTVVEPHAGMARMQREGGLEVVGSLDQLPPAPTVLLANEVLDALPVRRILMTEEGPREGRVAWEDGRFVEVASPLPSELAPHAERLRLEEGEAGEVSFDVGPLLSAMGRAAPKGIALFLDYGDGTPRPGGTLRGFRAHQVTDPFEAPGEQDVTADVDLAWVREEAERAGWRVAGQTTQGALLADLGLVEEMSAALARGETESYLAAKNLLLAGGMGTRFQALALARGIEGDAPHPGFRSTPRA